MSTFWHKIRQEMLDERQDDPSVFTGIGRMVNTLFAFEEDDDTTTRQGIGTSTVATSLIPGTSPHAAEIPSSKRYSWKQQDQQCRPTGRKSDREQGVIDGTDEKNLQVVPDLDWLDEAIAAAPLAPVVEDDQESTTTTTSTLEDDLAPVLETD